LGIDLLLRRRALLFFMQGRALRGGRKRDQHGKQHMWKRHVGQRSYISAGPLINGRNSTLMNRYGSAAVVETFPDA
jgi:hypothetical protein